MSEPKSQARPSQVTMAGWVAVIGSALLVLTLFESMSQLRSIEMRETVEEFLSSSPGNGLGLTVASTLEIIRGLMLVNGAAAAAAMVLGIYVLQRSNGARLGFSIAAVAIVLTAPVSGGFLPVLIAFAALMLWTGPAREWFSGVPRTASSAASPDSASMPAWPPSPSGDPSGEHPPPRPTSGFGTPPPAHGEQQLDAQAQGGQPPSGPAQPNPAWAAPSHPQPQQPMQYGVGYPVQPHPDPEKRPTTVTIALLLTWFFAGFTLVVFSVLVLVLLVAKEQFLDQVRQDQAFQQLDLSTDDLVAALWATSAVVMFWCLAAIVLAALAWRRSNAARIALVVSAASVLLFGMAAIPVGILNQAAAVATIALLFLGGANAWFSRKPVFRGYGPGSGYGQPSGGPQPGPPRQPGQSVPHEKEPPKNVW